MILRKADSRYVLIFTLTICISILCCINKTETPETIRNEPAPDTLHLVESVIPIEEEISGDMLVKVFDSTVFLVDKVNTTVWVLDKDLSLLDSHIFIVGKGPGELTGIIRSIAKRDDIFYVEDKNWGVHKYHLNWKHISSLKYSFNDFQSEAEFLEVLHGTPDPEDPRIYTAHTFKFELQILTDNNICIAVISEHPNFNPFYFSDYYSDGKARILALIDGNTGKVTKIFGRLSEPYHKGLLVPNFLGFDYSFFEDDTYVISFEIDPLIYIYDLNDNLIKKFGTPGYDMNMNYAITRTFEEAEEVYWDQRRQFGYYNSIYTLRAHENRFFLRTYTRGNGSSWDGLQIYREEKLVEEYLIPLGIRVVGNIGNTVYLAYYNEMKDDPDLTLFSFTI